MFYAFSLSKYIYISVDMRNENKEGLPEGGMEIRKGIGMQITPSVLSQHPCFVLVYEREVEKAMAPHSSTLAWKIPWTEEPGRLQSMGSRRVKHD